eukprot:2149749-Amphidinium_carterae.1
MEILKKEKRPLGRDTMSVLCRLQPLPHSELETQRDQHSELQECCSANQLEHKIIDLLVGHTEQSATLPLIHPWREAVRWLRKTIANQRHRKSRFHSLVLRQLAREVVAVDKKDA